MSDMIKIQVTLRDDFGKGAARQARRAGQIPAVVYGHGTDPVHILMPAQQTTLAVRNPNALLTLVHDGEEHLVLPKDIQRNFIKQTVDHLDLLVVRKGEKVVVDVPVHVEGEAAPNTVFNLEEATVPVLAEATHLPDNVTIVIEGRAAGEHVYGRDIQLPAGTTLELEDDYVIATISEPTVQDLGETGEGEAAAEGASEAPAEG
ncbi:MULTISPECIES: 50S ribosomal protein L25/general stress protein Ctc [Micrococcaceae]|uniref:50S ribosomal protein L25/general stress protein Ctc n=1 Tax=Micrococcaceae TaxID=1268 RepID=UPI0016181140|nr:MULTISPECIES: 50S ribosomal protein L25/general stress protein Ctc [Micrococcaceae]MBB5748092.1 large subunit ribosomal protein L25 [Micrococcus sp. TA1]HRO30482.1 50S ribosomal protein L25/general stress protein Ctc [Citricoccus sp.]HRO92577.1 50S ribosomal protein L25/general stress protein Ctc [Citricoccus sp.]